MLQASDENAELALLTWTARGAGSLQAEADEAYRSLEEALTERGLVPLQERIFADLEAMAGVLRGRHRVASGSEERWAVPPTCVEGSPPGRAGLAGIHVVAAREGGSRLITGRGGSVLGRVVETPDATLLGLADVGRGLQGRFATGPAEEAAATLDAAVALVEDEGFSFSEVIRTWFYLRDILSWYGPFNAVRNAAFKRLGLFGGNGRTAIPASTGIEARNARGAWCTLDLIAARPRPGGRFRLERLHSRRQNEATEYGSAFARGIALTLGQSRYVFVSGTAAIDDHGATVHVGDFEAQLRHTLEAVEAVLVSAGARLEQVRQATSFLKNPADARSYDRIGRKALSVVPVTTVADVCREDLLFELDATAVVSLGRAPSR